jgi:hypothetical protein
MYVDLQQFAAVLLPLHSTVFHADGNFRGNTLENGGKQNPKMGFKSPPSRDAIFKCFILNNLRSKMLEQIQNLDPHRLMSRLKIQVYSRRHSSNSAILLSTSGPKRWISMVMADDETSG